MSSPLISIEPTATIKAAAQTMISKKGRLVVFQRGRLIGIITAADLIKSLPDNPETSMTIDGVMTKHVIMVPSNTTVKEVTRIMGEKRIGSVLVTRRRKPSGIFSERDLLTTFLMRGKPLETPVGDAASSPLITIPQGTTVHQTALTMALKHIRRLPVVKGDKIVGIVTARDLVEAYAR
jgi:CBS domain-containing protein